MEQSITVDVTNGNPQVAQPPSPLMTSLLAVLESHISDLVIQQVSRILVNHTTMKMIDEGFRQQVKEIATEVAMDAVNTHEEAEYHISEDGVTDIATAAVEDHDFDSQISDAVNDAINEFDFEDIVRTAIKDSVTFTATISVD
jgi:Arc/MetJ family transcription regulator